MSEQDHGDEQNNGLFVFPEWHNKVPPLFFLVIGPVATIVAISCVWYYFSPKFTDVGYMPKQPVPYSHQLHAGEMEIDCRYCHNHVETTTKAGVPPTQTCMNCHNQIHTDSEKLAPVRESWATGKPVPWVRVHKVADYAYFDHSAHLQAGVGCESCHGRIDQMVEVRQEKPLSMGWCLDCHNDPTPHLRPKDKVTVMGYRRTAADEKRIEGDVNPPIHCGGCHR